MTRRARRRAISILVCGLLGAPAAVPCRATVNGFGDTDVPLALPPGVSGIAAAALDGAAGFAYFGTDSYPPVVVKVRLSDLTQVATLPMGPEVGAFRCAVLHDGYAYFGTAYGSVERIRLSDFSRAGPPTALPAFELDSAVVDASAGFAYFGSDRGTVARVRLSDFSPAGVLRVEADSRLDAAMIDSDSGFAYFCSSEKRSVTKIRLSDFRVAGATHLGSLSSAALDPTSGFAYFGTGAGITRLRVSDLAAAGSLPLPVPASVRAILVDPGRALYVASGTATVYRIDEIRLPDFTLGASVSLPSDESPVSCGLLVPGTGSFYLCGGTFFDAGGFVVQVRGSDLALTGRRWLAPGSTAIRCAAIDRDGGFAYFGTYGVPGAVAKVRLADFTLVGLLTLPEEERFLSSAVLDPAGGMLYLGTDTNPGHVVKIRLSDFTRVAGLTLPASDVGLRCGFLDPAGGFVYFGIWSYPGGVTKIRLSDFTRVGMLPFHLGEDHAGTAVVDPTTGFAYIGVESSPGAIVKVRLSDLTRVGSLLLPQGVSPYSAAIDPSGDAAYFGAGTEVLRIRLSDFTRTGSLALGNLAASSAVLVPGSGFVYFGSGSGVNRVHVPELTPGGSLQLHGYGSVTCALADPEPGYLYFGGGSSTRGIVSRVDVGVRVPTALRLSSSPNPSTLGQPVTFTANVSALSAAEPNEGMVLFRIEGFPVASPVPVVGGTATWTTLDLPVGRTLVSAIYSGSALFGSAYGRLDRDQYVSSRVAFVDLTATPNPSRVGRYVKIQASLDVQAGLSDLTGTVQIGWEGGNLGPPILLRPDRWSYEVVTADLPAGTHDISAAYSGDDSYDPATGTLETPLVVRAPAALGFYTVTPCRVVDTRSYSPKPLKPGESRRIAVGGTCGIPYTAAAASLNVTVTAPTADGYLAVWPDEDPPPPTSTLNFTAGRTRAANAIVELLPTQRQIVVYNGSGGTAHVILDVNGYLQ